MNVVKSIAARFGGTRPMARALGLPESTVRYWTDTGYISGAWLQLVLEAGQALDPPLTPEDFFDTREMTNAAPQKERTRHAAAD